MAIVKLQQAGESLTWTIKKAEVVAGKFGNQVKFENDGGDILFIPHDSAMRQLDRIGLQVVDCVGETLTIARDENKKGGAPYWSIRPAGPGDRQPAETRRMASPYQAPSMGKPIKGLDDFPDEEYGRSVQSPSGPDDDAYANPGPLPPFHKVHHKTVEVAPQAAERMKVAREYLDLLAWVQAEAKLPPDVAQSAAATIWISWGQRGLRA